MLSLNKFITHPEGYIEPSTTGFDYVFQYKDHLGNVRLSYSDMNKDGVVAPANWTTVFSDGFESASGWDGTGNTWGHPISGFDTNRKRSGTYSGRIDQPTSSPRAVHSMEWVPIDNSEATTYKYSCWAYSSGPKIRLALFMKQAGETGYLTLVDEVWNRYTKNQWVYLEGTVSVPTHIKTINIRLSSTSGQGSIWFDDVKIEKIGESEIVEESNYYPFGLKHKGYNNVINGTENNFKTYNGKEWNQSLNLNTFDLGARQMDPALGRFMVIDPMADFVNNQSPYAVADNNPIGYVDSYGFGSTPWWLRWLVGGSARNCSCKQRQGVIGAIGKLFDPKPGGKRRKSKKRRKNRKKATSSSPSQEYANGDKGRSPVSPVSLSSQGLTDLSSSTIDVNINMNVRTPETPIPEFRGNPVTPDNPVNFNTDVKFKSSSSDFRDTDHTDKILRDLIKTLKEYPQLKVLILGNFSNPTSGLTQDSSAQVNGSNGTVGQLQLERARAVEKFLINRGVNWRRILVGNGEISPGGQNNMNSTFILTNPNN